MSRPSITRWSKDKRHEHHGADDDSAVHRDRASARCCACPEWADCGRLMMGVESVEPENAAVGNRNGAAGHLRRRRACRRGLLRSARANDFFFNLVERQLVGVADHGDDQTAGRRIPAIDTSQQPSNIGSSPTIIAFTAGHSWAGPGQAALAKNDMKPRPTSQFLLGIDSLDFLRQLHHRSHVHLVEGGQHGPLVFGRHQTLRAMVRRIELDLFAPLLALARRSRISERPLPPGLSPPPGEAVRAPGFVLRFLGFFGVFFGDASVAAASFNLAGLPRPSSARILAAAWRCVTGSVGFLVCLRQPKTRS